VATAIARFEPVTMITKPKNVAEVSLRAGSGVSTFSLPHDDSWMRDNGPTFVVNGRGQVAGVNWQWNAWGNNYPDHERDAAVAGAVLEHLGMRRYAADFVLEGGAIHSDGEGTLLTTESVLLNPNRNPTLGRAELEELLAAYLGIRKVIWLGRGLQDDDTDGHVDELACFVRPGVVAALSESDPADANYAALADNLARLGRRPMPPDIARSSRSRSRTRTADGRRMAQCYQFHIANGGVSCRFRGPAGRPRLRDRSPPVPRPRGRPSPALDVHVGGRHPLHHPAAARRRPGDLTHATRSGGSRLAKKASRLSRHLKPMALRVSTVALPRCGSRNVFCSGR
jgi:agmatine deiminase